MIYCKKCVQPNTRPGIEFDSRGICPPCQYIEKLPEINWDKRKEEMMDLIKFGNENNVSGYNCIIGVSGGKDSTRQAVYVREELGMNPLLVSCMYPPEQQTDRGAENLGNLISLGFDTISVAPNPEAWRKLMREGFLRFGNWCKSTEMALYASLPRVAIAYHIPLIFLGENPAIQLGALEVGSDTWDANRMKNSNTIVEGPDSLMTKGVSEKDLIWYRYPSDEDMKRGNLQLVYLGYFWKNFTKLDNASFSISRGLEIRTDIPDDRGALHPFEALDDEFVFVNQMMKYRKFGFGKVTDEACELIRFGKISRSEGIELVHKYDGKCSSYYIDRFCKYINISKKKFWKVVNKYTNKALFDYDRKGNITPKFSIA